MELMVCITMSTFVAAGSLWSIVTHGISGPVDRQHVAMTDVHYYTNRSTLCTHNDVSFSF